MRIGEIKPLYVITLEFKGLNNMKKFYKVKARQETLYEKVVEAKSEEEAYDIFFETRDDYDIVQDDGLEINDIILCELEEENHG